MSFGAFAFAVCFAFIGVVFLTPVLSFLTLQKEQDRIAEFSSRPQMRSILFTEVLLRAEVVLVFAFGLAVFLGMVVYVNAHAAVTSGVRTEPSVPLTAVLVFGAAILLLAFVGWRPHEFTLDKLHKQASSG